MLKIYALSWFTGQIRHIIEYHSPHQMWWMQQQRRSGWEDSVKRAGPPHRAASVSLLPGLEFLLTTWFSTPHLPGISMLTVVTNPLEPAEEGPRQTDPHDTQTNAARRQPTGTPHMFHGGNAKHPALSSTSEHSAHLCCRCTVSRKEARGCCTTLHARLDGGCEWLCLSISTQHTFVLYIEAEHTCVYVYNHMACSRSSSFVGGRREV